MPMDTIIRRGHPIAFGFLVFVSIIEMCIAAWITARYNSRNDFPDHTTRDRVRYILFVSVWTVVFGSAYLGLFLFAAGSALMSIASHIGFLLLTWILWVGAAAAITQTLGGTLKCSTQIYFTYCGQLNALEGFAWLISIVVTFLLVVALLRGISSAKRGDGYGGSLTAA